MSERVVKVPDVGEGVAEAELVEWHVAVGDAVAADQPIAEVMTDKATVEIPSPVAGTITWIGGQLGDTLAVGSELVRISLDGAAPPRPDPDPESEPQRDPETDAQPEDETPEPERVTPGQPAEIDRNRAQRDGSDSFLQPPSLTSGKRAVGPDGGRPTAAPAVRLRAQEAGVDLRMVAGTGPAGRVTYADLDDHLTDRDAGGSTARRGARSAPPDDSVAETKLIGLRKRIAQRMAEANAHVPQITYVDEVDVTSLQQLRESINAEAVEGQPKLTILPFLVAALVEAVREHPQCNARFDDHEPDGTGVLHVHRGVHVGVATQTGHGLVVPVLRHAEDLDLFEVASEIERLATTARSGKATSAELSGSTITITSLGALGGLVTTPIVNRPEVAIVGVNKLQVRPVWDGTAFAPRTMMNLSSSFDHRIVDGWDAAQFVQRIKRRLESPALLLVPPSHRSVEAHPSAGGTDGGSPDTRERSNTRMEDS